MFDQKTFDSDPCGYALDLVDQGLINPETMLRSALQWMSYDDVRRMLDANELSPRFGEG